MHTAHKAAGPPPAPERNRTSPWAAVAQDCRNDPGEWYEAVGEHAPSVATYLRREWGLEIRTVNKHKVTQGDKEVERCSLWLRWTEESQAHADELERQRQADEDGEGENTQAEPSPGVEPSATPDEPTPAAWATDDDETDWEGAVANPNPADVTG